MAALQAVSDPASLDRGLAGSNQEVAISSSSAKQRHRRCCWNVSLKISSCRLACASAESRENGGMQSYRKLGGKKVGQKQGKVCLLFAILVLLHKSS